MTATARACANIALVKYWGKRDAQLNLPATGSLSLTLEALATETSVDFDPGLAEDFLELDGVVVEAKRISGFLDVVRRMAGIATKARVVSANNFPTASGLASSASGFAALAVAATRAAKLDLDARALSRLARQGSGSAARSIFGGFARMHAGDTDDAAFAEPIEVAAGFVDKVRMVIAVVGGGAPKARTSRDAMEHTAATSPFYRGWLEVVPKDLARAEAALAKGDLEQLGEVAEANAFAMHASALAARPAIVYWQPATLALLAEVHGLRACGVPAWGTCDAGPHVKILTTAEDAERVQDAVRVVDGVTAVTISAAGRGAM